MEEQHRDALRRNRVNICRDLDGKTATSHLYSKEILTETDKDDIGQAASTPTQKNEMLLDILAKRGPKAFPAFMEFLKDNQKHLFDLLTPPSEESRSDKTDNAVPTPLPDNKPAFTPVQDTAGVDGEQADKISKENSEAPDEGDGNRSSLFKNIPSSHSDGIDLSQVYQMTHRPRGHALVINNKIFEPSSGMQKYPRNGTDVDADALKRLFCSLGFLTEVLHNATTKDTFRAFEKYARMDHSNYDCFICAILTHGEEGVIYTADQKIAIKELTSKFRGKLPGKPKLFFFQACQGFEYMEGSDQPDGADGADVDEVDAPGNNAITLPVEADFLYAYSTVPGYYSWRNSVRGSWFAQAIVSVFEKYAGTMDVLRMMTRVNNEVARQKSNTNEYFSDNKKQISSVITQLRKELYFFPENVVGTAVEDGSQTEKKNGTKCSIA